uniref:Uncharacterized protein n=1 Tax=Anopheles coluzzii TaxID=1518534 RepID=A0A8W7P9J2_ANOCL
MEKVVITRLSSRLDTSSGAASGAPFGSRAVVPEGCCRFGLCRDLDHFFVFPLPFPLWVDGGSGAALLAVVGGADAAASLQAFSELGMCSDRLQCGVRSIRMLISAGSAGCRGSPVAVLPAQVRIVRVEADDAGQQPTGSCRLPTVQLHQLQK